MATAESIPGRRSRSAVGQRRTSRIYQFRDLDPETDIRIGELSLTLGVPRGRVVDEAIRILYQRICAQVAEDPSGYCHTITKAFRGMDPATFMSLIQGKAQSSSDNPKLIELEQRLADRRRQRDELMGRT